MTPFELAQPRSLREAIELLDPEDSSVRPIAGGTAVMLMMKSGLFHPRRLVSLRAVESDYSRIEVDADGNLRIGALAPLAIVERSRAVRVAAPVIVQTLKTLSNVRVRNVATVGGALAHADPHMDLPPLLTALGATATIAGPGGSRGVPVEALYAGYLENTLGRQEIITHVNVPAMGRKRAAYLKCTTRSADDWPAVGIAAVLDGDDVRVVLSAATDQPVRLLSSEKILRGKAADPEAVKQAGEAAAEEVRIESDLHGSAAYKKQLIRVYLARAIHEARNAGR